MNREDKLRIIDELAQKINDTAHFYLTDISGLNAEDTSYIRRKCFEKGIELVVVKNTLLGKAFKKFDGRYDGLKSVLAGSTSIMFCQENSVPGKLIKELRNKFDKPVLKGAYVEESIYIGDNQLDALANIKSKEDLIGEIIGLLQSPIRNVISSLQSGGHTIAGVVKTLSERE